MFLCIFSSSPVWPFIMPSPSARHNKIIKVKMNNGPRKNAICKDRRVYKFMLGCLNDLCNECFSWFFSDRRQYATNRLVSRANWRARNSIIALRTKCSTYIQHPNFKHEFDQWRYFLWFINNKFCKFPILVSFYSISALMGSHSFSTPKTVKPRLVRSPRDDQSFDINVSRNNNIKRESSSFSSNITDVALFR